MRFGGLQFFWIFQLPCDCMSLLKACLYMSPTLKLIEGLFGMLSLALDSTICKRGHVSELCEVRYDG